MANGTIAFDTLQTSGQISGTAKSVDTDYLASGVKVWCNHQQAATFVIHDSLNITSVTDQGAGHAFPQHTNNMSSGKYAVSMCCNQVSYNTSSDTTLDGSNSSSQHTCQGINGSNVGTDASYMCSSLSGDLA